MQKLDAEAHAGGDGGGGEGGGKGGVGEGGGEGGGGDGGGDGEATPISPIPPPPTPTLISLPFIMTHKMAARIVRKEPELELAAVSLAMATAAGTNRSRR